jgi:hypothetical protein
MIIAAFRLVHRPLFRGVAFLNCTLFFWAQSGAINYLNIESLNPIFDDSKNH